MIELSVAQLQAIDIAIKATAGPRIKLLGYMKCIAGIGTSIEIKWLGADFITIVYSAVMSCTS